MRFERREDCYYDTETVLEWSLCNIGSKLNWANAIRACAELGYRWRLPTLPELLSLVDYEKKNPATMLPNMRSSCYWSATPNVNYTSGVWLVDFNYGYDGGDYESSNGYVRAVRGGPLRYDTCRSI